MTPQKAETARTNGRPLGIGQLGGYQTPTAKPLVTQGSLASEAELASRAYQRLALELPGSLGRQAAALSAFYGNLARQTVGVAR